MTSTVCWQLYPSGEKNNGYFLSRGYSHALGSCWQHSRKPKKGIVTEMFLLLPFSSSQTVSAGVAAASSSFCAVGEDLCQFIFGGEEDLNRKGG